MRVTVTAAVIIVLWQCCFGHDSVFHEKITLVQDPNDKQYVVFVTWLDKDSDDHRCRMSTNSKLIYKVRRTIHDNSIHSPSKKEMQDIMEECHFLSSKRRRSTETTGEDDKDNEAVQEHPVDAHSILIFPGTKWCGNGDIAENYDDLGDQQDTDRCCRAHDNCADYMTAGETKHNLTNHSPFTRLSCDCDDAFHHCLERVNSITSNTVGNLYFNVLRNMCYTKVYPFGKNCKHYRSFLKIICKEYERDLTQPQEYQFVKTKLYRKISIPGHLTITF